MMNTRAAFVALLSTEKPYATVHSGHLSACRPAPGDRQLASQSANLTYESACTLSYAKHSPIAICTMHTATCMPTSVSSAIFYQCFFLFYFYYFSSVAFNTVRIAWGGVRNTRDRISCDAGSGADFLQRSDSSGVDFRHETCWENNFPFLVLFSYVKHAISRKLLKLCAGQSEKQPVEFFISFRCERIVTPRVECWTHLLDIK